MAPSPFKQHWTLDPDVLFLNHGSFGACPKVVLEHQTELRARMERQPVQFLIRDLEGLLDRSRQVLGAFIGADPAGLAWVSNATMGVNSVLRSLKFEPGDELLVTDQEYQASRNALDFVAERWGARVVVVNVPFPTTGPQQVIDLVLSAVTDRTRLALLDHITSQTGILLPIDALVPLLHERGVEVLVDGAHAPGQIPLDLTALNVDYFTGNCHKWLCTPKGSALLYVREDHRDKIRPVSISHGASSTRTDRSRYHLEFDWLGTVDPTPWLCVPTALEFMGTLFPDGWDGLRRHNRQQVLQGRDVLCAALGVDAPAPDSMIGSLAAVELPDGQPGDSESSLYGDPLQERLLAGWNIEVPIVPWPGPPKRLVRISSQAYNDPSQYETLGSALKQLFG